MLTGGIAGVHIPGRQHEVQQLFLEDLMALQLLVGQKGESICLGQGSMYASRLVIPPAVIGSVEHTASTLILTIAGA